MKDIYGNGIYGLYDPGLHIFVDDRGIRNRFNVTRKWGQLKKHPKPLISHLKPWEESCIQPNTIIYDDETKKFRCWYRASDSSAPENRQGLVCYAHSDDGLNWEQPDLGLFEWRGNKNNNICLTGESMYPLDMNLPMVIKDIYDPDPERRYKLVAYMQDIRMYSRRELWAINHYLFTSPDGICWKTPGRNINAKSASDRFWLMFDQKRNMWVASMGVSSGRGEIRMISLKESKDLENWSEPVIPFKLDDREGLGDIYDHHTIYPFLYGDQYLGHFSRYETRSYYLKDELISSRDFYHWERPMRDNDFHRIGSEGDHDDHWAHTTNNPPIPVGDKLYFYYQAGRMAGKYKMTMGLATLRRDGFAAMMNLSKRGTGGWVLTEPVTVLDKDLFINLIVYEGGMLKVGILTDDYKAIEEFGPDDCIPVTDSGIRVVVKWKGKNDIRQFVGKRVCFKFELFRISMYAYKFGKVSKDNGL